MNLVVLIKAHAPQIWFVNRVHQQHPVSLVVVEKSYNIKNRFKKRIKNLDLFGLIQGAKNVFFNHRKINKSIKAAGANHAIIPSLTSSHTHAHFVRYRDNDI